MAEFTVDLVKHVSCTRKVKPTTKSFRYFEIGSSRRIRYTIRRDLIINEVYKEEPGVDPVEINHKASIIEMVRRCLVERIYEGKEIGMRRRAS